MGAMKSLERVRRFVTRCLNVDLQRELKKLKPGEELDKDVRKRLEIDWGTIPGVDKPFLMQPGAEKFLFWLNLRPKYEKREVDLGEGHMEVIAAVHLFHKKTHEPVFDGPECSCTTMETNYRFRFQERLDDAGNNLRPSEQEAERLKAQKLGKFIKKAIWARGKKKGEEWVWLDRVENPNIHDERNKVRQIAEKRALVKAVRNGGALSELFVTNPEEWELEQDEDYNAGPTEDAQYSEGGRRIVNVTPKPPVNETAEEAYARREKEQMEQLTPEQRSYVEGRMREAAQHVTMPRAVPPPAANLPKPPKPVDLMPENAPIFWKWSEEFHIGVVFGSSKVMERAKAIIATNSTFRNNKIIVNADQLEALKYVLPRAGYEFKQAQREPGES